MTPHQAAAAADLGVAHARKSGRNERWPYVPVVRVPREGLPGEFTERQILGVAYSTRQEALDVAQRTIDAERRLLEKKLGQANYRALRAQYNVDQD